MKKLILLPLSLLFSFNAFATGGFACSYEENGVTVEIGGVTTRSFENDIVSLDGLLATNTSGRQNFSKEHARQYWNNGDEFRLLLYAETESLAEIVSSTKVIIETVSKDGIDFVGTISIEHRSKTGTVLVDKRPITCGLE